MKYVFFGTPRFAEIILGKLIEAGMPPVAVVCNPDRPVGRKKIITPPPTKILTIETSPDVDIIQPEKLDEVFTTRLRALEPDLFVVAAYAKILPKTILDIPQFGALGMHPSLLPKFRGASPIQSAILAGEPTTGVTLYSMDEKTDHGPIVAQQPLERPISELCYLDLEEKLAVLGSRLLIQTIPGIAAGKIALHRQPQPQMQDESRATYTKKFTTEDAFIDEKDLAEAIAGNREKAATILRKINAFNPEPGAWTIQNGTRIKLLAARLQPGTNGLVLLETQRAGERPQHTQRARHAA